MTRWEAERAYQLLASIAAEGHGAHPFVKLTLFITLFERDHRHPLGFHRSSRSCTPA